MAKFRKKPVIIEAFQYRYQDEHLASTPGVCHCTEKNCKPHIHTLEGTMTVSDGDWIIVDVKGEKYPCKPDIFAATYEPVKEVL